MLIDVVLNAAGSQQRIVDPLTGLNAEQYRAVTHDDGPLLVLAGAGSGKTRVLTHRIAQLVKTGRARPDEILAITFTNKAAAEMRARATALVGNRVRAMWIMTFHSACARMLRAEAARLGYGRNFTIYDAADSRRLIKRCLDRIDADPKRFKPSGVGARISEAKNRLQSADDFDAAQGDWFEHTVAETYRLYESELMRMNAMDFDDLLMRVVNVFELFPEVRDRYAAAFRYVLVDEYQDTNHAQYRLLQLISGSGRNLCVVGDDAQSIYRFRGADIRNILDFQDDFPAAEVIKLERNYRSTQPILTAANGIIAANRSQIGKRLWTERAGGEPVVVRELLDEHAEARYVLGEIERLVAEEGATLDQIAVFYRTNAQSRVLEDTLVRADIDYQVIGGAKFYERAEIKDAIAYLTVLVNPADVVAFVRIVNTPKRGIGQSSVQRILNYAAGIEMPVLDAVIAATATARSPGIPGLPAAASRSLARLAQTLASLRERAQSSSSSGSPSTIAEILTAVLDRSGYREALESERTLEAEGRIENLDELVRVAEEFTADGRDDVSQLEAFLQQVALSSDGDARRDDAEMVTLMTLHNAKGLEYPHVFMIGCEEQLFPHARAIEAGDIEEERRLCYVGITRAMWTLTLTHVQRRSIFGSQSTCTPSRFLDELPDTVIDRSSVAGRTGLKADAQSGQVRPRARSSWGQMRPQMRRKGDRTENGKPQQTAAEYRPGDAVLHAVFGAGTVTTVEPGGVIGVRFGVEYGERKLMADYAPLSRR